MGKDRDIERSNNMEAQKVRLHVVALATNRNRQICRDANRALRDVLINLLRTVEPRLNF
jgi:hypothetical protein